MKGKDKGQIAGVQTERASVTETTEMYLHLGQSCQKSSLNMPKKNQPNKKPWER